MYSYNYLIILNALTNLNEINYEKKKRKKKVVKRQKKNVSIETIDMRNALHSTMLKFKRARI